MDICEILFSLLMSRKPSFSKYWGLYGMFSLSLDIARSLTLSILRSLEWLERHGLHDSTRNIREYWIRSPLQESVGEKKPTRNSPMMSCSFSEGQGLLKVIKYKLGTQ